ncbi:MAG: HD domain-containing protein [Thermoanaerobacterales bacterium]|nr:HD domain-containing protein [Thermoanaerobacterales bacterium]
MLRDYRDPIHGFISVDDCEQEIIGTRYFQRLRNINQLGTTFLVYPSAMHTRFEHSLGTLFVIDKMLSGLVARHGETLGWRGEDINRYRTLARLAALLHDLGHPPFSHAAEDLLGRSKSGSKIRHEDVTYRLITETEISKIIDKHHGKGTSGIVAQIAVGTAREEYAARIHMNALSYLS